MYVRGNSVPTDDRATLRARTAAQTLGARRRDDPLAAVALCIASLAIITALRRFLIAATFRRGVRSTGGLLIHVLLLRLVRTVALLPGFPRLPVSLHEAGAAAAAFSVASVPLRVSERGEKERRKIEERVTHRGK